MLSGVPNAPIRIIAMIIIVTFPSKIAAKARLKPEFKAPSRVFPARISSLILSDVMIFASTPIPTERMIPAIPGIVRIELFIKSKYPETNASIPATCPARAMTATAPGSL